MTEFLEINYPDIPCVYIVDPRNLPHVKKYKLLNEITEENVSNLVTQWLNGKLKPTLKSEEIPTEDYTSRVKEIVGKNYEEVVNQEGKHVIVYFYGSHCENCIDFEPKYNELAEAMQSNKNIIFTKIEGNKNEVDGLILEEFPTILFYSKENKPEYIKYDGMRFTFEDLALWINQNTLESNTKSDL